MATMHWLRRPMSRWRNGVPTACAHPDCDTAFEGAAFAGKSGKLYCTRFCRDDNNDDTSLEDRLRSSN